MCGHVSLYGVKWHQVDQVGVKKGQVTSDSRVWLRLKLCELEFGLVILRTVQWDEDMWGARRMIVVGWGWINLNVTGWVGFVRLESDWVWLNLKLGWSMFWGGVKLCKFGYGQVWFSVIGWGWKTWEKGVWINDEWEGQYNIFPNKTFFYHM